MVLKKLLGLVDLSSLAIYIHKATKVIEVYKD